MDNSFQRECQPQTWLKKVVSFCKSMMAQTHQTLYSFGFGFSTMFNLYDHLSIKTRANIIRICCFEVSEIGSFEALPNVLQSDLQLVHPMWKTAYAEILWAFVSTVCGLKTPSGPVWQQLQARLVTCPTIRSTKIRVQKMAPLGLSVSIVSSFNSFIGISQILKKKSRR